MEWPIALVAELAARRCIVFLGTGASASCLSQDESTRPPGWNLFLEKLKAQIPSATNLSEIEDLIFKEKYLDAAEIILNKISSADFTRIIRELFVTPRYQASSIHESILKIDPKIVVTTNYDDIYDNYCRTGMAREGYNICKYYEKHLVADLRSPVRLVVKAHGCVSDPSQIILSRSQYFKERQNNNTFYSVLDALFLTHTLLFIGYSISDPDIQLVLENASITAPSAHPHYAFIQDNISDDIEKALAKSYNIQYLKYPAGDYDYANNAIIDLAESVEQFRVTNPI